MSLIQDALKRQLDEQAGHTYTPPPVPTPRRSRGALGKFAGMLFALLFLVSVAGALFYLAAKKWSWKDAMQAAQTDMNTAGKKISDMASTKAPEAKPKPAQAAASSSPYASVQQRVEKMKGEVEEYKEQTSGAFEEPTSPAAAMKQAKAKAAATEVALAEVAQREQVPAPEPKKAGAWPAVTVNGVMSAGSANAAAIINNRMVSAGETLGSVKIVEVQSKGVVMEFKGETRLVLIGQTTE